MHADELSLVRSLVPVAWADGVFEQKEKEMLDALLDAYGATAAEREGLHAYAATKRSLDEIQMQDLSAGDRRLLLHLAVILTLADGKQADAEMAVLEQLWTKLRVPEAEAKTIVKSAGERAKASMNLL
jgi:tellurite resistance protein